ncbi:MAG TPA: 50S ribosomal protein L1 [Armatimonadota bacterium]|nr:50S ribosomal protein L1 [Armatimonadota bacterium]
MLGRSWSALQRYQESAAQVDKSRIYDPVEAIEIVKKIANAKFDETVDLAVKLGVDPRHGDQMVRGVTPLPHGSGKKRRVAVFARGENAQAAEEAGADAVGAEDLVAKIQAGADKEFDVFLATPDVMGIVGRLGRVLTQRMPNPKAGTVTPDIARAVREVKTGGRVEFKVEKTGIVHMPIGKASYTVDQLRENFSAAIGAILKARPAAAKGHYLQQIVISSTMGPGLRIDTAAAARIADK